MSYVYNSSHLLDYQKLDGTILTFNLSILHTLIKKFNLIFEQVNKLLDSNPEFQILYDEFLTILSDDNDKFCRTIVFKINFKENQYYFS